VITSQTQYRVFELMWDNIRSHPHIVRHKKGQISSGVPNAGVSKPSLFSNSILDALIDVLLWVTATRDSEQNKDKGIDLLLILRLNISYV
jgi:hypothetical protein